ncbi:hypothetical protein ACQP3J_32765, partial [Escherichia coli]
SIMPSPTVLPVNLMDHIFQRVSSLCISYPIFVSNAPKHNISNAKEVPGYKYGKTDFLWYYIAVLQEM